MINATSLIVSDNVASNIVNDVKEILHKKLSEIQVIPTNELCEDFFNKNIVDLILVISEDFQKDKEICLLTSENSLLKHIPIIKIIKDTSPETRKSVFDAGFTDYIFAPIEQNELISKVKYHIEGLRNTFRIKNLISKLEKKTDDYSLMENHLRESEERYRLLVELSTDAILICNKEGLCLFANTGAVFMFDLESYQQMLDRSIFDFIHIDSKREIKQHFEEIINNGGRTSLKEYKFINENNDVIEVELSSLYFNYNNTPAVLIIARDIKERKRIERMREGVQRMVRHDIKNPLNSIIGFAQLLLQKFSEDGKIKFWVSKIYESGFRILKMINNSINLFKMEEGIYKISPEKFNFIKLFEDLKYDFSALLTKNSQKLEFFFDNQPMDFDSEYIINGERDNLTNLFTNLILNAIEAEEEGATITVSLCEKDNHCEVTIHNKAVIPEAVRDKFFDKYVSYGKENGTGLGTYSAILIANVHNGSISFESSEDSGTDLIVRLPI